MFINQHGNSLAAILAHVALQRNEIYVSQFTSIVYLSEIMISKLCSFYTEDAILNRSTPIYLDHFKYIVPAGSPMTGIGNNFQVASLSNCFVIGLDGDADSYGAILRIDEE